MLTVRKILCFARDDGTLRQSFVQWLRLRDMLKREMCHRALVAAHWGAAGALDVEQALLGPRGTNRHPVRPANLLYRAAMTAFPRPAGSRSQS